MACAVESSVYSSAVRTLFPGPMSALDAFLTLKYCSTLSSGTNTSRYNAICSYPWTMPTMASDAHHPSAIHHPLLNAQSLHVGIGYSILCRTSRMGDGGGYAEGHEPS